jgi:hypothetical protein
MSAEIKGSLLARYFQVDLQFRSPKSYTMATDFPQRWYSTRGTNAREAVSEHVLHGIGRPIHPCRNFAYSPCSAHLLAAYLPAHGTSAVPPIHCRSDYTLRELPAPDVYCTASAAAMMMRPTMQTPVHRAAFQPYAPKAEPSAPPKKYVTM